MNWPLPAACYESEYNPGKARRSRAEAEARLPNELGPVDARRLRSEVTPKMGAIRPCRGETSHFSVTSRHEDYISSGVNERHLDVSWLISIGRRRRSKRAGPSVRDCPPIADGSIVGRHRYKEMRAGRKLLSVIVCSGKLGDRSPLQARAERKREITSFSTEKKKKTVDLTKIIVTLGPKSYFSVVLTQ